MLVLLLQSVLCRGFENPGLSVNNNAGALNLSMELSRKHEVGARA